MGRECDSRVYKKETGTRRQPEDWHAAAETVSKALPGKHRIHIESFDARQGTPSAIRSEEAASERGDWTRRAREHLEAIGPAVLFSHGQAGEYLVDESFQEGSDGSVTVHVQQCMNGVEIFQASQAVRFGPDGRLKETVGRAISVGESLSATPSLSVEEAARKAAAHIAVHDDDEEGADEFGEPLVFESVDLSEFDASVVERDPDCPARSARLAAGPFDERIAAQLLWFPVDEGDLRLSWEFVFTMPKRTGQYRVLVDASSGEILYCRQLMRFAAARGRVFRSDGGSNREFVDFPEPLATYGLPIPTDLPTGAPEDWVSVQQAVGNSVLARLGDSTQTARGEVENGVAVFDFDSDTGDPQKVLNIFYFNCFMHDFFYLLGFRERDGNFQRDNFARGGVEADRVDARAHSAAVFGTANMSRSIEGENPVMNMGLVTSTDRHTAFDGTVVYHEFTHGVTGRLVGGPQNDRALDELQSGGMGEGWGDYIACSVLGTTTVGSWVVNNAAGIRDFAFDENFPDNFGNVGQGRYTGVHNIGEIWAATLMDLNRRIGRNLALQLMVDSLKLMSANPSFLDARDATLAALDNRREAGLMTAAEHAVAHNGTWAVFAAKGMGPAAESIGATIFGIEADFNAPEPLPVPGQDDQPPTDPEPQPEGDRLQVEIAPNLPIPDADAAGVQSVITVGTRAKIASVSVSVDIEHTFISDLRVRLASAAGTLVVLHAHTGGDDDDIIRTYTPESVPKLADLQGEPANGQWSLRVADLVGLDTGRLRRWGLDLQLKPATDRVRFLSQDTPKAIPDADEAGISSSIVVAQSVEIGRIFVPVEIRHTFIADLEVSLVSPTGRVIRLHDQTGGSSDDIVRTYTSLDAPDLAELQGGDAQGEWRLTVVDRVGQDTGTLTRWGLEIITGDPPSSDSGEVDPSLSIPDLDPVGVDSTIAISSLGRVREVGVSVDISHTFRGDLRVSLFSPSGTRVELHQNAGGSANDLVKTYSSQDDDALRVLRGEDAEGNWVLRVADTAAADLGTLNRWTLELSYI